MKKYQIIYADPPWRFFAGGNRNATRYYNCMKLEDIKALPIKDLTDDNCALFLWITHPMLQQGLDVLNAWGFRFATVAFDWMKLNKKANTLFIGCGYWTRANGELCILGIKGKMERKSRSVPEALLTHREAHSKKPDEARDRIVQLMGDLPRIELFAREKTDGWDVWGNEVESDIDLTNKEG